MRWALLVVILCGGCLESAVILCDDGRTCGAGTTCDTTHHLCVSKKAFSACSGLVDGNDCTFDGNAGMCSAGVCLELLCGDGVKLGGEECDGTDLGGVADCTGVGFYDPGAPGDVFCTPGCTINRDKCKRRCGDGVLDPEERCDTNVTADNDDCTEVGYYRTGPVTCNASCVPDVSQCKGYCGDGTLDPEESCDATDPDGATPLETCIDGGYDAGRMACTKFCTPDYKECKYIGWRNTIPGAQGAYSDILVTDASTYFLGSGNGFMKVVNKMPQSVLFATQQLGINSMRGTGTDMWVVGRLGLIGHYDGTQVTQVVAPSGNDADTLYSLWGSSNTNMYAAGNYRVLHNTGGSTWSLEIDDVNTYYHAVWGTPTGSDVYAVGTPASASGYKLLHRLSNGTWQSELISGVTAGQQLYGVSGTGSSPIVLGYPGVIARRNGSGTWDQELYDVPAAAGLSKLWARGANDMFVVGESAGAGEIGYYDGTWWRLQTGIQYGVSGIHGINDDVLAISGDKVLKHANVSWSLPIPSSGQSIVAVAAVAADRTYVLSRHRLQVTTCGPFEGVVGPDDVLLAPNFTNSPIQSNELGNEKALPCT